MNIDLLPRRTLHKAISSTAELVDEARAGHKSQCLRGSKLGGDDKVALILAVLVVDQNESP
jgi:hypothetical protein